MLFWVGMQMGKLNTTQWSGHHWLWAFALVGGAAGRAVSKSQTLAHTCSHSCILTFAEVERVIEPMSDWRAVNDWKPLSECNLIKQIKVVRQLGGGPVPSECFSVNWKYVQRTRTNMPTAGGRGGVFGWFWVFFVALNN